MTQAHQLRRRRHSTPQPCSTCSVRERSLCSSVPAGVHRSIDKLALTRGEALVHEDARFDAVCVVQSGVLVGSKMLSDGRRQVIGLFYPGDVIHRDPNRPGDGRADISIEAATPAHVCRYARGEVIRLAERHAGLARHLRRLTERELQATHDLMLVLSRASARERVAYFLLRLSQRAQERAEPATPVWLPISRQTIGDHLGLTTETASRVLSRFRQDGLIRQTAHADDVHLCDMTGLQQVAGLHLESVARPT